jgi:hypothetical protein
MSRHVTLEDAARAVFGKNAGDNGDERERERERKPKITLPKLKFLEQPMPPDIPLPRKPDRSRTPARNRAQRQRAQ